jgi:hypothetical protein
MVTEQMNDMQLVMLSLGLRKNNPTCGVDEKWSSAEVRSSRRLIFGSWGSELESRTQKSASVKTLTVSEVIKSPTD